jgi:hypothetical protein
MNDRTAIAVQDAALIVEGAAHVDVGNIDMPMLVRLWWLLETGPFARRLTPSIGRVLRTRRRYDISLAAFVAFTKRCA